MLVQVFHSQAYIFTCNLERPRVSAKKNKQQICKPHAYVTRFLIFLIYNHAHCEF